MKVQSQFPNTNLLLGLLLLICGLHPATTAAHPHSPLRQLGGDRASFIVRAANRDNFSQLSDVPRALAKREILGMGFGKLVIIVVILALGVCVAVWWNCLRKKPQQGKD